MIFKSRFENRDAPIFSENLGHSSLKTLKKRSLASVIDNVQSVKAGKFSQSNSFSWTEHQGEFLQKHAKLLQNLGNTCYFMVNSFKNFSSDKLKLCPVSQIRRVSPQFISEGPPIFAILFQF